MDFADVVTRRRMHRAFEERPLPGHVVERMVRTCLRGPSAGFTQGTELLVLESASDRKLYWEVSTDLGYRERMPWRGLLHAPLIVVVMANEEAYRRRYAEPDKARAGGTGPHGAGWAVVDASFTAMLLLLAAVDEGLGALFFAVRRPAALRVAFGVPEDFEPLGTVAVGHPRPDRASASLARGRRPLEEVVHRGRW